MSQIDIAADRAIIDAATPGPWESDDDCDETGNFKYHFTVVRDSEGYNLIRLSETHANACLARFIAEARSRWPAALDEVERLRILRVELSVALTNLLKAATPFIFEGAADSQDRERLKTEHAAADAVLSSEADDYNERPIPDYRLKIADDQVVELQKMVAEQNATIAELRAGLDGAAQALAEIADDHPEVNPIASEAIRRADSMLAKTAQKEGT